MPNLPYNSEQMPPRSPRSIPEALLNEPPSVKVLWLFLRPQGEVTYSQRDLAELTGIPLASVQFAFKRLNKLRMVEYQGEVLARQKRRYSMLAAPAEEKVHERV